LPAHRLTASLTDDLEKEFYKRCPPEQTPYFMRDKASLDAKDGDSGSSTISTPSDVEKGVKPEKGEKPVDGDEGKKKQKSDYKLLYALYSVFWLRWWTAGIMKLIGGKYNLSFWCIGGLTITLRYL
jgi:ATP-binding cassette, subfamily C (CFTR/MRP), member 1